MIEIYLKSLHMIKYLNINSEKEYIMLSKKYNLLLLQSLKYIAQNRNFKQIIELAKELD